MRAALLLLLPCCVALAAPPPPEKNIAALVIPMDRAAESSVVKFETFMTEALAAFPGWEVKRSEELFGLPVDDDVRATHQRAEKGFEEGRQAFEAHKNDDAERKLRTALKEFERSAALLKTCSHLCDTLAMYGAVLQARGDTEEAKLVLLDLMSLSPAYELNTKKYQKEFIAFRQQASGSLPASLRGTAVVRTKPSGSRVFVDGELRGYTPVSVGPLAMGKHLLRLEHPGYRQRGEMIEITPEEQEVTADLVPTPVYKKYNASQDQMAQETSRPTAGPAIVGNAHTLNLDRVIVGVVKELKDDSGTEMTMGLFDVRSGRRLADKKIIFQGDEFGQLKAEVGRATTALVNAASGQRDRPSHTQDPLDGRHGMEEWTGEDRGGHNAAAEHRSTAKDPLDGHSGTEDW